MADSTPTLTPPRRRRPLLRVGIANLLNHKARLALTLLAVIMGTAFVSASLVFTSTMENSFSKIFTQDANHMDLYVSSDNRVGQVPLSFRQEILKVPNVKGAKPEFSGGVILLDKQDDPQTVQSSDVPADGYFDRVGDLTSGRVLDSGRYPTADDEIVLGTNLARKLGYKLGDKVSFITTLRGVETATLVGTDTLTEGAGRDEVLLSADHAVSSLSDGEHANGIIVQLRNNSPEAVAKTRQQLHKLFPKYSVKTGHQITNERNENLRQGLAFFNYFLLAFAIIALVVGIFLIYNTFAMIVAQRIRELALLRAIGTTRRQVTVSVLAEASLIGLVGSVLGAVVGIGVAFGLAQALAKVGMPISEGSLSVPSHAILVPIVLGMIVTLISAWVPARKAGRTPPVQAMRQDTNTATGSFVTRTIVGVISLIGGLVTAIAAGLTLTGKVGLVVVGVGAFATIVGIFLAGAALSQPVMRFLGLVLRPFPHFRNIGQLAERNSLRNPIRTSTTAFALALGLMLVSMVGVMGASTRASVDNTIHGGLKCDFVITAPAGMGIPKQFSPDMNNMVGVEDSSTVYPGFGTVNGRDIVFATTDRDARNLVNYQLAEGRNDLTGLSLMVSRDFSEKNNIHPGDKVNVQTVSGPMMIPVNGVYEPNAVLGDVVVSFKLYEKMLPPAQQFAYLILVQSNRMYDEYTMKAQLQNAVAKQKILQVKTIKEFAGDQAKTIDTLLAGLYALLALSIIIAILGVVNTLALSVRERRQEIGMLRAIGMSRGKLREMFYIESTFISIFGALLGTSTGTLLGWALTRTMMSVGLTITVIPWQMILGVLLSSVVVGVIAAVGPSIRASRIGPLKAISD